MMKIGGWKTESIAKYSVGATSSEQVYDNKKKKLGLSYADASEPPPVSYTHLTLPTILLV